MKVELTPEEANNVQVALISLAKTSNIDVNSMKVLLVLSDKFRVDTPKTSKKESKKK